MCEINKIYEALVNRQKKIYHRSEIVKIIKEYKQTFKSSLNIDNVLKYLSRHQYVKRIFLSYYYINSADERNNYCLYEDKELLFLVLNKLQINWCVGLNSALYLSGKSWQTPRVLHVVNDRFSQERKILSLKVKFFKIKQSLFFGLKKAKTKNKIEYYYSNPTKTQLDLIYLRQSDKLTKSKLTKKYLKYYPKWLGKK